MYQLFSSLSSPDVHDGMSLEAESTFVVTVRRCKGRRVYGGTGGLDRQDQMQAR